MIARRAGPLCLLLLARATAGLSLLKNEAVDKSVVQVPLREWGASAGNEQLQLAQRQPPGWRELEPLQIAPYTAQAAGLEQREKGPAPRLLKELAVPIAATLCGLAALHAEATRLIGKLLLFFGAQTFMNLYMKAVLSRSIVSSELGMAGVPAAFAITAIQQLVSFALLAAGALASQLTPWKYSPNKKTTPRQLGMVLCFSLSFTLNIALNNFSLSMLDISVNLMIRSVAPLTTVIVQIVFSRFLGSKSLELVEIGLMFAGALFGLVAVIAKGHGGDFPKGFGPPF